VGFAWADPTFSALPLVTGLGLLAWYHEATHRVASHATTRQRLWFLLGVVTLVIATSWPLNSLASSVSLLALVFQRELIVLVAAPLLLLGLPTMVAARLSRPAPLDWIAARAAKPVPALVTTTVVFMVTAVPPVVTYGTSHAWVRSLMILATFFAGIVLWLPVINRVPGVPHLRPMSKAVYLMAQSLAPTFLSFAWVFAPHALYHSLHGQHAALGLRPLGDQQLSGYLSKLGFFGVLWSVAFALFMRAPEEEPEDSGPLHWIDVERAIERAQRQERRGAALTPGADPDGGPLD